jgi:His-Xaa-Ser system protein HxsD
MRIDRRIYSDNVISKAIYWLAKDYAIQRTLIDDFSENVIAVPNNGQPLNDDMWASRLTESLNDFKLRELVAIETHDIKTILYAKAFAEDESFSEDDITD